jgi:hypothetical protein
MKRRCSAWRHITGGTIEFQQVYVPPGPVVCFQACGPSYTIWEIGWIPDYPSPAASWQSAYAPTGLWGSANAVSQTLTQGVYGGVFNDTAVCGHYNPTAANLTYWADRPDQVVPQVCQGTALNVTTYFANQASYTSNDTLAAQGWDLVQAVYNNLQLTVGMAEQDSIFTYAPWINANSINTNVEIGGSSEWAWYQLSGNGLY